jgi:hypothetical protein
MIGAVQVVSFAGMIIGVVFIMGTDPSSLGDLVFDLVKESRYSLSGSQHIHPSGGKLYRVDASINPRKTPTALAMPLKSSHFMRVISQQQSAVVPAIIISIKQRQITLRQKDPEFFFD